MKYKYLLPRSAQSMDKALGYFRRELEGTDSSLVRAVANGREFICEAMRILHAPYAPCGKGLSRPAIRPEGLPNTLGVLRTLSRLVEDAARVETPFLRVSDACCGNLLK